MNGSGGPVPPGERERFLDHGPRRRDRAGGARGPWRSPSTAAGRTERAAASGRRPPRARAPPPSAPGASRGGRAAAAGARGGARRGRCRAPGGSRPGCARGRALEHAAESRPARPGRTRPGAPRATASATQPVSAASERMSCRLCSNTRGSCLGRFRRRYSKYTAGISAPGRSSSR